MTVDATDSRHVDPAVGEVGWFGKVPALGDFVSRRMDPGLRDEFDTWLSSGMAAGASVCGEAWRDLYLAFPIWRFVRIDSSPHRRAWIGLLAPGADRVGRLYPVVIAIPTAPDTTAGEPLDRIDTRLQRIEEALLDLLADDDIDRFEHSLLAPSNVAADADGTQPPSLAESIARSWMRDDATSTMTFWQPPSDGTRSLVTHRGRPDASLFLRLVGATGADSDGR